MMSYQKPCLIDLLTGRVSAQCGDGSAPSYDNNCISGGTIGQASCGLGSLTLSICEYGSSAKMKCNTGGAVLPACYSGMTF